MEVCLKLTHGPFFNLLFMKTRRVYEKNFCPSICNVTNFLTRRKFEKLSLTLEI